MKYRAANATGQFAGEIHIPAETEKALFFGPSMSMQTVNLTGTETKVTLWVGGAGLDKDRANGWGEPIQFFWTQPNHVSSLFAKSHAKLVLRQCFDQLKDKYTTPTARIIISMLENCIDGHIYKREFSREEAESFNHV